MSDKRETKGIATTFTKIELAYLYDALDVVIVNNECIDDEEIKVSSAVAKQLRFKISRLL